MNILQSISILTEAIICVYGLLIVLRNKKVYGWGIALTFAIYVFYDLANYLILGIPKDIMYALFFLATISILWAVVLIYREGCCRQESCCK